MSWRAHPLFGASAAVLSGVLLAVSRDVGPVGPLILVAPVPVLVYALAAPRAWSVAAAAFVAQLIGAVALAAAYAEIIPLAALVALLLLQGTIFTVVVLLTRWTARGRPAWIGVLSYASFAAAIEFLFGLISPHGSSGAVGYALVDVLPLLQLASVGGMAALAFVAGLCAMTCAMLIVVPRAWRTILVAGGVPLLAALAFGVTRLQERHEANVRVALGSIDSLSAHAMEGDGQAREVAQTYADLARKMAAEHPEIIVFPEKVLAQIAEPLETAALETRSPIVAGFDETLPDSRRVNSARVFGPDGSQQRYIKRKPIPGVELGFAVGDDPLVLGDRGVAVCKDMDFAPMIREYGQRGVRLMLVPAWDFVFDGRLHARMAVVRGVENGFALARAAADGRLTISDRYGRIVAEATTSRARTVSLVAEVGLRGGSTVYARVGDLFGWFVVVVSVLLVGMGMRPRRG